MVKGHIGFKKRLRHGVGMEIMWYPGILDTGKKFREKKVTPGNSTEYFNYFQNTNSIYSREVSIGSDQLYYTVLLILLSILPQLTLR